MTSSFKRYFGLALCALTSTVYAANGGYRISGYLGAGSDARMVMIDGGYLDGIASGDQFRVFRPATGARNVGVSVETGQAKALMIYEHKTVAEITVQSTPISQQFYPNFADVMAGDIAVQQRIEIRQALALAPDVVFFYKAIFEDAKASPQNFELTQEGKDEISREATRLSGMRAGMLMVIGHTDSKGPSESNQIESYQRAVVVRQYLVDQLGFDASRVVAIGKGEDELPEEELTPGLADRARRVVLKVVPLPKGQ